MATISNLFIDQGSDYSTIVTVSSVTGQPLNLTGYTVASQMRKSYNSSVFHNFTCTVSDAVAGKIQMTLTALATEAIAPGRWLYDVEITEVATSKKQRVVEGIVTITPQITKI